MPRTVQVTRPDGQVDTYEQTAGTVMPGDGTLTVIAHEGANAIYDAGEWASVVVGPNRLVEG